MTGFSAVIGSWKIIDMRVPRSSRRRAGVRLQHVLALRAGSCPPLAGSSLRQQAHHRLRDDRLARARFAHQADDLAARRPMKRDVLDGMRRGPTRAAARP